MIMKVTREEAIERFKTAFSECFQFRLLVLKRANRVRLIRFIIFVLPKINRLVILILLKKEDMYFHFFPKGHLEKKVLRLTISRKVRKKFLKEAGYRDLVYEEARENNTCLAFCLCTG